MPAIIYGEIDPDGQRIELFQQDAGYWEVKDIQERLRFCTPLIKPDKEDRVFAPLSWVAVTQIVHSFPEVERFKWVPGPKLSGWLLEECIRRSCQGDLLGPKPAREPMPHQSAGAIAIGMNGRFLLADEPGCGKTQAALMGLNELAARNRPAFPAIVVCPATVIDPWLEDIAQVYPEWSQYCFAYRGPNRKRLLKTRINGQKPKILVMSYETMRNDVGETGHKSDLMDYLPQTVLFDECVPHATLIATPTGDKKISDLREGDLVTGIDRVTGRKAWTPVLGVSRSPIRDTVRLGDLELTANHPLWVLDSATSVVYAASYAEGMHLRELRVREDVPGEGFSVPASEEVLFSGVRTNVAGDGREVQGHTSPEYGEGEHLRRGEGVPEFEQEPVQGTAGSSYPHEGSCDDGCGWLADANGREWHGTYYPAGTALEAARRGIHPRVLNRPEEGAGLPEALLRGPGLPPAEADLGDGRAIAPVEGKENLGREAGREASITWLDDSADQERTSPERSLWNIETGTGNYVAAGVLVHNCHKLCNYRTKQSMRARRLARHAPNVIGMSGTPITSNAGNFWPILNSMYPESYPDRDRYKSRYTLDKGQDYGFEVGGLDPVREPEFRLVMQGTMRRVAKIDVMKDLPPKTYQTRWVEIPEKWRTAYDEMEEDMIAHLPDSEHTTALTAMSTLAKMMRLRQLACSACDVETYEELDLKEGSETFGEMVEKIRVTPKLPCWKGDALLELMEELHQGYAPGERTGMRPVIAAAPYKQLITLCGGMAEKAGYKVGYIVGGMSDKQRTETRLAFQENKLDLICVTTGAGGTGLTLTAADTVAFVARPWPYVEALQMEDRAHRRGQLKNVQIIDIETRSSIEARVRAKLHDKAANLAELLQDPRIALDFLGGQRKASA